MPSPSSAVRVVDQLAALGDVAAESVTRDGHTPVFDPETETFVGAAVVGYDPQLTNPSTLSVGIPFTPLGITDDGTAYYDPDGATAGEEAYLRLTTGGRLRLTRVRVA